MSKVLMVVLLIIVAFTFGHWQGYDSYRSMVAVGWERQARVAELWEEINWGREFGSTGAIGLDVEGITIIGCTFYETDPNSAVEIWVL